jgi:hypothetical protein
MIKHPQLWELHAMQRDNNINGVDGDPRNTRTGTDGQQGLGHQPDLQYLLSRRAPERLSAPEWRAARRARRGIERGLHQRLDVSADEDRSRVRHRNAAWTLGMFRRNSMSLFMHWRGQDPRPTKATLADFHEEMGLEHQARAFALANTKESRALEASRASRDSSEVC